MSEPPTTNALDNGTGPTDSDGSRLAQRELHVVTEDGEQCFMWRSNKLTYLAPNRRELPLVLAKRFGHLATKLDLSYNNLTSFRNINLFTSLNELVLDNNNLADEQLDFRQNLRLKTLSLNKNKLCDLYKLIISIKVCFPNLEFLSLIGNQFTPIKITPTRGRAAAAADSRQAIVAGSRPPGATRSSASENHHAKIMGQAAPAVVDPSSNSSSDSERLTDFNNQTYRCFIINHLPNLHFLDSSPISGRERDAALNSCFWLEEGQSADQPRTGPTICGHIDDDYDNILDGSLSQQLIGVPNHEPRVGSIHRSELQLARVRAIGADQLAKGQLFSQQVKCQMVGGFTFARTLLWTLMSLTSTNLAHCSGALLALSFKKGPRRGKNRLVEGAKKNKKESNKEEEEP